MMHADCLIRGSYLINQVAKGERLRVCPSSLGSSQVGVCHQKQAGRLKRAESTDLIRPNLTLPHTEQPLSSDHLKLTSSRTCAT